MSTVTRAAERLVRTSVPGVYRRGNRYVVVFRDPQGRQRKRSARTLAEARALKAELQADVKRGEYRALSRVTFGEYAREWVASYQGRTSRGIRPETRASYRDHLEREAIPFFGRMPLAAIEPRDVKRFAASLAARGLAPTSVRRIVAPVRALLATAFEEGVIRANPAAGVRLAQPAEPSDEGERAKALTEEELRALLAELPDEWRLFFRFLAYTGLRISEAVALTWGDIDFAKRRVHVRRRRSQGRLDVPKSRYGRRAVPLSKGLARALAQARGLAPNEAPVFPSAAGGYIEPSNLMRRVLKPAARRAGVPWVGFHTFRHTCASILFRHGLNAKQVQAWLGHHSPAFTLATYVHLLPDDLPSADFLDALGDGQGGNTWATEAPESGRDREVGAGAR